MHSFLSRGRVGGIVASYSGDLGYKLGAQKTAVLTEIVRVFFGNNNRYNQLPQIGLVAKTVSNL